MKKGSIIILVIVVAIIFFWGMGSYNGLVTSQENVNTQWANVQNQYQRRADLIPNLVSTVKGYAAHEASTFAAVTEARAKIGQVVQLDASKIAGDVVLQKKLLEAQQGLNASLGRLIAVAENYPQLKADQNFLQLQAQLEGTENRIAVERQRYITTVQDYNTYIRQFPVNLTAMVFGHKTKPNFTVENEAQIQQAPSVDFGAPAPTQPAPQPAPAPANG